MSLKEIREKIVTDFFLGKVCVLAFANCGCQLLGNVLFIK